LHISNLNATVSLTGEGGR
jgi:hypothetical protein